MGVVRQRLKDPPEGLGVADFAHLLVPGRVVKGHRPPPVVAREGQDRDRTYGAQQVVARLGQLRAAVVPRVVNETCLEGVLWRTAPAGRFDQGRQRRSSPARVDHDAGVDRLADLGTHPDDVRHAGDDLGTGDKTPYGDKSQGVVDNFSASGFSPLAS